MPLAFYMDQHVPWAITLGLRLRRVAVLTAYEDGTSEVDDAALLDRASELGRVLFTRDDGLLAEAAKTTKSGNPVPRRYLCASTSGVDWEMRAGLGNHCKGRRTRRSPERGHVPAPLKIGIASRQEAGRTRLLRLPRRLSSLRLALPHAGERRIRLPARGWRGGGA
jgi:hypothetical protein